MKRKYLMLFSVVLLLSMIFSGCSSNNSEQKVKEDNVAGIYQPVTYEAIAKGYGGDVKVTITISPSLMVKLTSLRACIVSCSR
jgi:uncharacterized protein YceK